MFTGRHALVFSGKAIVLLTVGLMIGIGMAVCLGRYMFAFDREQGWAALHDAVAHGTIADVKQLVRQGADVNARTASGNTPLDFAIDNGLINKAAVLLNAGADVNAGQQGYTPLMQAVSLENAAMVKLLLAHKANVNAHAQDGMTALKIARESHEKTILQLLKQAGAKE